MNPAAETPGRRGGLVAGVGRTAATIAAVAIAARFVGVIRVFAQVSAIGRGPLGDAYASANKIPNIVFDLVAGGALSSVIIPVLARPIAARDKAGTRQTASALLTWTVLLLVPVGVVGILLSRPLMSLLLAGISDPQIRRDKVDVSARMLVVFMPQIVLYGVGIVLTGVLQAHRRFLAPALAPLLSSLVVIGAYLAYAAQAHGDHSIAGLSRAEELTLSVGTTLGVAALTLPLIFPARRLDLRLRPTLRMPAGAGRQIRKLAFAGAIGLGAQQLAAGVVIVLANQVVGALIVYELAWTVFMVPWAVLAVPIATSVFPDLTQSAAAGDDDAYAASLAAALRGVVIAMLIAAAMLTAAARPVSELMLALVPASEAGAGATDLARAISAFAPGLVGYGLIALLTRAAYARHESRVAAMATASGFAITAALDVALVAILPRHWLVAGLGAGNTIGMSIAAAALLWWLRRATGKAVTAGSTRVTVVGVLAAALAAVGGSFVAGLLPTTGVRSAALAAAIAVAISLVIFAAATAAGLGQEGRMLLGRAVLRQDSLIRAARPTDRDVP